MKSLFSKIVDVKPNEVRALWLGFAFHFIILTAYYIVRPIRDTIAASNKLETLPWMFTATLIVMLAANAIYGAIVARMDRRKFIPFAYAFFILMLILFFILMRSGSAAQQVWTGRAFYVWVSVFNLFNTAIFWAFMTDLFTVEQGKRLYGFIAVGGSLGAIAGAYITKNLIRDIGPANLVAISATMFAIVCFLVRFFPDNVSSSASSAVPARQEPIGGSPWSGITHILRSPYMFGLAATILLYTITSTWAYFQQSDLTRETLKTSADRTVFLSNLEIWVNTITVLIQIFLTGRFLKWFGVAFTLTALPFLSMLGFTAMAVAPSLAMLAFFQVIRRTGAYALLRPSREILFTVLRREDKYKVKGVTDTLGYRVGDQIGAWSYGGLGPNGLHLSLGAISWIAVPVTAGWCALSIWLARKQRALVEAQEQSRAEAVRAT